MISNGKTPVAAAAASIPLPTPAHRCCARICRVSVPQIPFVLPWWPPVDPWRATVQGGPYELGQPADVQQRLLAARQQFVETPAGHVPLALANPRLCDGLRAQSIRDPVSACLTVAIWMKPCPA